ncbi:MAG TPA: GrpB family protein [Pyrinomonadaceae bacterium]|jgi:GrpB-like predicted nucleotidyltransferase (UPF0157 family)
MLGLDRKSVKLVSHKKEWKTLFEREEKLLRDALGRLALAVEHIGSTAIPEIKAKPIIDIMVGVRDLPDVEKCLSPLEKIGYEYLGEMGVAGRHYFRKGTSTISTHHLNIVELGGDFWKNHIFFRDYLRENAEAARQYDKLKNDLATKYKDNRESYTDGKTEFVGEILQKSNFSAQN